jgi:hypothetical protein
MDDVAEWNSARAASKEGAIAHELLREKTFERLSPVFVAKVLSGLDEAVARWNARPTTIQRVVPVKATTNEHAFQLVDQTLTVGYSVAERQLGVSICVGIFPIVAPERIIDSYELAAHDGGLIAKRYGGAMRGAATSVEEVVSEILTTFLRTDD